MSPWVHTRWPMAGAAAQRTSALVCRAHVQGYNGTVLAYGQTGSGKTHTMAGGVGDYGVKEPGITPQVIAHMFSLVDQIRRRLKPGETIRVSASAVEIYNETLRDLSKPLPKESQGHWDAKAGARSTGLSLQEIPTGQGNRVRALSTLLPLCTPAAAIAMLVACVAHIERRTCV